jgi:hypothetical protein
MYLFILAYLILLLSFFTYDERFNVPSTDVISPTQVPSLDANKITSGELSVDRIPTNIPLEKMATGTLPSRLSIQGSSIIGNIPSTSYTAGTGNIIAIKSISNNGYKFYNAADKLNALEIDASQLRGIIPADLITTLTNSLNSGKISILNGKFYKYLSSSPEKIDASELYGTIPASLLTGVGGLKASGVSNGDAKFGKLTCDSLEISSDRRIKKNIQPLDPSINRLRKLKPVRYQLKNGDKEVCGFIAQEIKEVIPSAVSTQTSFISNICDEATVDKDILTFATILDLEPLSKIKIKINEQEYNVTILEVLDEHRIRIDQEFSEEKAYVIGQEVSDFLSIDSHQIFTVATAALQELDLKVQRLEELDAKVQRLEEENKALLQRFIRLEEFLNRA